MADDPYWFAPKRYGYGAGLPIAWQGWALMLGFVAIAIGLGVTIEDRPLQAAAILAPLTVALLVVSARKTRGGWRWRWGEEE
ncbi:MAG TPA: hypothetical protein VIL42_05760 [Sphingomicrobium sp.]|jgi:hypothetical protein